MLMDLLIPPGLLALLFIAQEIGFRFGQHARIASKESSEPVGQVGAVQGAVLGLLGLLLGFSFAGAASRFLERQDLITAEANAIGTAFLRADMLDDPHRAALRAAIRDYHEHRVRLSTTLRQGLSPVAIQEINDFHVRIWKAAAEGANAKVAVAMTVLPPVNDVIDVHTLRVASGRKHLPPQIVVLLLGCSVIAMSVMGYGGGLSGRRNLILLTSLIILIATALWTTIDLDRPRSGLLQLNDAVLRDLKLE